MGTAFPTMIAICANEFATITPSAVDFDIPHIGRDAALDQEIKPAVKKIAEELAASTVDSRWIKLLSAGTPEFVPVKRYSVAELFRLRKNASKSVEVDVHHIENSIVSARQRAEFQSPIPLVNPFPMVEPLFVPLYVPCEPAKEKCECEDSDSARSTSPTVAHVSSDEEVEQEQQQKVKKVHRSRRGGKRHPNPNKKEETQTESSVVEESSEWQTVEKAARANKNRVSKADLAAKSGEAFSSAVMKKRRLAAKERARK